MGFDYIVNPYGRMGMETRHLIHYEAWVWLGALGAVLACWIGAGYLRADALFLCGLGAVALSMHRRSAPPMQGTAWRYARIALALGLTALAVPSRSFYLLILVFVVFFVLENVWGRINEAPALIAVMLTAVVKTMTVILGFPLRLQLSSNAAQVLALAGMDAQAEGNLIRLAGRQYIVDEACTGLHMVEVSFICCFMLIGLFERKSSRRLPWQWVAAAALFTGAMVLLFNQLRILLLVLLDIPPESFWHGGAGLIGLAVYVFVPLWWVLKWIFRKKGIPYPPAEPGQWQLLPSMGMRWSARVFCVFLVYAAWADKGIQQTLLAKAITPVGIPEQAVKTSLPEGVLRYAADSLLIYVKPVRNWFSPEHTPLICWEGSGYSFGQILEREVGGTTIYCGILEKEGAPLYHTAWWFDNGQERTISQRRWRTLEAGGAPGFSLVNVTAANPEALNKQLEIMLGKRGISHELHELHELQ